MTDPYETLGVTAAASNEEITRAYRTLARKYHPDVNPGDVAAEGKMKEVNAAYEQIKDIRAGKTAYQSAGAAGARTGGNPYSSAGGNPYGNFYGPFGDPFGSYYGQRRQSENDPAGEPRRTVRRRPLLLRIFMVILAIQLLAGMAGCVRDTLWGLLYGDSRSPGYVSAWSAEDAGNNG